MRMLFLAFLSLSLPVFAQHSHDEHAQHLPAKRKTINAADKIEITEVLGANDKLFNAFLKKDSASVEKMAKDLQATLSKSKSPILKDVRAQASKLNIKSALKIEDNMKSYEALLNPLIKVVKEYEVESKYNVFSCPMVKKSWLQDITVNKDVKNVYAMDMLECGTQDTQF